MATPPHRLSESDVQAFHSRFDGPLRSRGRIASPPNARKLLHVHLGWLLIGWLLMGCTATGQCRDAARWQALVSPAGQVELFAGRQRMATISPGLFEATWRSAGLGGVQAEGTAGDVLRGTIRAPGGTVVDSELRAQPSADGLSLAYRLTPREAITLNSLHVAVNLPIRLLAGQEFVADGERGTLPAEFGDVHVRSAPTQSLVLSLAEGRVLRVDLPAATPVLLQDNRQWGPSFSVRIGPQFSEGRQWPAGQPLDLAFTISTPEGIDVAFDRPVTIEAGSEWVPLALELDIVPGSALDFSGMGQVDPPAGKHGWLIARPDGQLAFEGDPESPRRFYGVNLCFSAHYITHEQADRLAERLMRLGYNTVRFHHYEGELVDRSQGTTTSLRADKLDQLDYLLAALKKRGIYMTTDLFVSRPVFAGEIWESAEGDLGMNDFKMLVPVNERAFENWKGFSRNLLTHVNPYTGLTFAQDPAIAWLAMINEGNVGNYLRGLDERVARDWQVAWNRFLSARYGSRQAIEDAWGVSVEGDPAAGTVPLPTNPYEDSPRGCDVVAFLTQTERDMFARMEQFLRKELAVKALLTNMNGWTNPIQNQAARADFGYVDDHFYVDHPRFLEGSWRLPSRCDNRSPIAEGAPGGRSCAFVRLMDKPFTISEYNYSGPGRFRGVGGILTGCLAALQRWGVVWRFAYSHSRNSMFGPSPAGYFDLASDPLNQAAERAALCLYLCGDMDPAPHAIAIASTSEELLLHSAHRRDAAPPWTALALVTRVGTFLADRTMEVPADLVLPLGWHTPPGAYRGGEVLDADPYADETGTKLLAAMRERGWLRDNVTDLAARRVQSETGQLLVDGPRDVMVLNTPATAGCYAPEGETVEIGPVSIAVEETDATVWVSSVDGLPIAQSRRLIITHLTDLQNSGARFGERARQTLLAWGELPHLVLAGSATVSLRLSNPERARVWALATSGRRLAPVEAAVRDGALVVPLQVRGNEGARMIYEVEIP